jgi:hypothetical protein
VVRRPVAGCFTERRIDNQIGRILADREHVLEEPQQPFLTPAAASQI